MTSFRPALNSTAIVSSVLAPCLYSSSPGLPQGIRPRAVVCPLSLSAVWPAPKETGKAIRLPHHHRVSALPRSRAPPRRGPSARPVDPLTRPDVPPIQRAPQPHRHRLRDRRHSPHRPAAGAVKRHFFALPPPQLFDDLAGIDPPAQRERGQPTDPFSL